MPNRIIDAKCTHCGAAAGEPCRSVGNKPVAAGPHMKRIDAAGVRTIPEGGTNDGWATAMEDYTRDVVQLLFGCVDRDLLKRARRDRSIDFSKTWVKDALAREAFKKEQQAKLSRDRRPTHVVRGRGTTWEEHTFWSYIVHRLEGVKPGELVAVLHTGDRVVFDEQGRKWLAAQEVEREGFVPGKWWHITARPSRDGVLYVHTLDAEPERDLETTPAPVAAAAPKDQRQYTLL